MKFHIKPFADNLNEYPWSFNLFQQGIHLLNRTSYIKIRILPQLSLDLNKGYFICFGIYAHQIYGFKIRNRSISIQHIPSLLHQFH